MLALPEDTIELWRVQQAAVSPEQLTAMCLPWLHGDELRRYHRFRFDRHRHQYLLGRALMRLVLSRYSPLAPADWLFVENSHGKPAIDPALGQAGLYFNLSHSDGSLVLAVARHELLGVDIEATGKSRRILEIAERYFTPAELALLNSRPPAQQLSCFYELWTLKEAYIKARGLGLAIPLHQFEFDFPGASGLSLNTSAELKDEPRRWQLWLLDAERDDARLALAVKSQSVAIRSLRSRQLVGLEDFVERETRVLRSQA